MLQADFKDQVRQLTPIERDELVALLAAMAIDEDPDLQEDLARKIDDSTPGNWVGLDELRLMAAKL